MKRLVLRILLFSIVFLSVNVFSKNVPHYMRDVGVFSCEPSSDPLEARKNLLFALSQTRTLWPEEWISVPNIVGQGIWESVIVHGKEVKIYLRDYKKDGEKFYFYSGKGIKELSPTEYTELVNFLKDQLYVASYELFERLKDVPKKIKRELPDYEKSWKINESYSLSFKEILGLPEFYSPADFLPDELYFGPIEPWGMVYLGLYGGYDRRIFLHPEATVYDCVSSGKPIVLMHEMIHAQPTLQWIPLAWYTDVEILAELSSGLWEPYFFEFAHPYLAVLNDLIEAFFGYSYDKAGRYSLFRSESASLIWPDETRIKVHQKVWEKIAPEIRNWVLNDLLIDFYKDPLYALGINIKYCWDSAFLAVSFSKKFELAGLGGLEKTQGWLSENEKLIEQVWEEALRKTGNQIENNGESYNGLYPDRDFCPQPFSFSQMKDPKVKELVKEIQEDLSKYGRDFVINKFLRGGYRKSW